MRDWTPGNINTPPFKEMVVIDQKDGGFSELRQCAECGQFWQVGFVDKYETGLAYKIQDPNKWRVFDPMPAKIQQAIEQHHGLSDETCAWQNCNNKALKGKAICPYCAITKMGLNY